MDTSITFEGVNFNISNIPDNKSDFIEMCLSKRAFAEKYHDLSKRKAVAKAAYDYISSTSESYQQRLQKSMIKK